MSYTPTEWKDRVVEKPRTFNMQNNPDGTVTLTPAPGTVVQEGTPVNAANLNKIEQGFVSHLADGAHMPSGGIIMWSGTYAAIPTGWLLCNGQNGTPDLRDRFILGATTESEIGNTGGSNEVTLTENQMPSHSHSGNTNTAGSHTHSIYYRGVSGSYTGLAANRSIEAGGSVTTSSAGNHSHTLSIDSTGGGQPHENRPAFYKLAFIMKA